MKHSLPEAAWPNAEVARSSRLFSTARLGRTLLTTSRTWVPAMVPWRATEDGFVTDANVDWYARFAAGRPGVLVVEATGIRDVPSGPLLRIGHDRFVPGLRRIVDAVRESSGGATRLLIQVIDFLSIRRRPQAAVYFSRYFAPDDGHRARLAEAERDGALRVASDDEIRRHLAAADDAVVEAVLLPRELESLRYGHRERVWDLHLDHVRDLPRTLPPLFSAAALRAREAGFDGVELHFAHAYTMASFLSPLNRRDDGYGGDLAGRLRLPLEVVRAAREAVGDDYCVGARFLGDEVIAGGLRVDEASLIGVALARAGLDFLSISKGGKFEDAKQPRVGEAVYPYTGPSGLECMPTVRIDERGPFGRNVELAATVRRAVREAGLSTPVVAAGGLCEFSQMESVLERGDADFIAAARQSLADPDWWEKVRRGDGALVRRCEYTNYCEGLDQKHKQVTCRLWDRLPAAGSPTAADGRRLLPP